MDIIVLQIGTNTDTGNQMLRNEFPDISWWSDNEETLAHYYEGCALEIIITLDSTVKQEYIRTKEQASEQYTYGFAEISCPAGAIWYSISSLYLKEHLISIKEIYPDLSKYQEDE